MNPAHYQGTPCIHGHSGARYISNGGCVECEAAWRKSRYEKNREAISAQKQGYYQANKERLLERAKQWEQANREYVRLYRRARYALKREQQLSQLGG